MKPHKENSFCVEYVRVCVKRMMWNCGCGIQKIEKSHSRRSASMCSLDPPWCCKVVTWSEETNIVLIPSVARPFHFPPMVLGLVASSLVRTDDLL
jgi:hypothetical protein